MLKLFHRRKWRNNQTKNRIKNMIKIKKNRAATRHRDGTVSYWSVMSQTWMRSASISDADHAALPQADRAKFVNNQKTK
jgi:hypothetical protein